MYLRECMLKLQICKYYQCFSGGYELKERVNLNKVAFILCINNIKEYGEAKRYIDNLFVPKGFETDIITIQEASSMCQGYNVGMKSTDAKYKVYLHQDVRIINKNFIVDLLKIFEDPEVGIVGMVGTRKMAKDGYALSIWDTGGVYYNGDGYGAIYYNKSNALYTEVDAIDGLLFATQYDVPFREDIFTEFDFYDVSACYEFKRKGYKVVTACQDEPWTYHNDHNLNMKNYDYNRQKFLDEYSVDFDFIKDKHNIYDSEKDEKIRQQFVLLEKIINEKGMKGISQEILNNGNCNRYMKDVKLLAAICQYEKERTAFNWCGDINEMYCSLNELKCFLKRIEYDLPMKKEEYKYFCENYSLYSVVSVTINYCLKKRKIFEQLYEYIPEKDIIQKFIQETKNTYSWKEEMDFFAGVKLFNKEKWDERRKILVILGDLEEGKNIKMDDMDWSSVIVITMFKIPIVDELINKQIPLIIGTPMCIKFYSMEMKWDIEKVYIVGKGIMADEAKRIYANSHIPLEA